MDFFEKYFSLHSSLKQLRKSWLHYLWSNKLCLTSEIFLKYPCDIKTPYYFSRFLRTIWKLPQKNSKPHMYIYYRNCFVNFINSLRKITLDIFMFLRQVFVFCNIQVFHTEIPFVFQFECSKNLRIFNELNSIHWFNVYICFLCICVWSRKKVLWHQR